MSRLKFFATVATASVFLFTGCTQMDVSPNGGDSRVSNLVAGPEANLSLTVPLATASNFAVLAGTTVTNDGASVIGQDLGVSPGTAITGFQPAPINTIMGPGTVTAGLGIVDGTIYAGGPVAAQAHNDAVIAYNYLVAQVPGTIYSGVTQLNGLTFTPGVYRFEPSANLQVGGIVYLDFQGNADAQFIFQMGTTLVTMAGSQVIALNNNNQTCIGSNVYWAVGSSATIDGLQFIGNVVATTTITMTSGSSVSGKLWALNGAVTMISDTITACSGGTGTTPPPKPCNDFITGGGWIKGASNKDKSTFGVSGGIKNGSFWGQLSYNDHNGTKVKSTSVTSYLVVDASTRQIEGVAKVNGIGSFTYTVIVSDNGENGRNDSFSLVLSNGYSVSGKLMGGNIQLHKQCGEHREHDDGKSHDNDEKEGNENCDKPLSR
jgi:hypothetical protein